jgi:pilus assembly protein Flp/PilA
MKGMVMKNFVKMLKDESGASAAEYALILAIVGTAIAAAAITLGGTIATSLGDASTCISTNGATCN